MIIEGDYTAEEISNALFVVEQVVRHEVNERVIKEMRISLHVLRAVNSIGRGTEWLSNLSQELK